MKCKVRTKLDVNIQNSTLPKASIRDIIHGQFMMIHVQRQLIHN